MQTCQLFYSFQFYYHFIKTNEIWYKFRGQGFILIGHLYRVFT